MCVFRLHALCVYRCERYLWISAQQSVGHLRLSLERTVSHFVRRFWEIDILHRRSFSSTQHYSCEVARTANDKRFCDIASTVFDSVAVIDEKSLVSFLLLRCFLYTYLNYLILDLIKSFEFLMVE